MKKSKFLVTVLTTSMAIVITTSPLSQVAQANVDQNDSKVQQEVGAIESANNYITVNATDKTYNFDQQSYKVDTSATESEIESIQNEVNNINSNLKSVRHVKVENDQLVAYATDEEIEQELSKQGYNVKNNQSENDVNKNKIVTEAAQGGVTKAVYGKNGKVKLYLSHKVATNIVKVGSLGATTILAPYLAAKSSMINSFASGLVAMFGGSGIPKNGVIINGKVDGTVTSITKQ